jgi:hypothetical protein
MPSLNTGNAILSNPIKVETTAYNVGIGGAASSSFKLQVTGTTNLTGALTGTSATFSTTLGVTGNATFSNNVNIGGSTTDRFGVTGTGGTTGFVRFTDGVTAALFFGVSSGTPYLHSNNNTLSFGATGANTFSPTMTLSSGNVGIGVTPNTWAGTNTKALQVYLGSMASSLTFGTAFTFNSYYDGSWKYTGSFSAGKYEIGGNEHIWYSAPDGTAGNVVTFTERMRITSGGDVGIGNSGFASTRLTTTGKDNTSSNYAFVANNSSNSNLFLVRNDGAVIANGPVYRYSGQTVVGGSFTNLTAIDLSSSRTYLIQMIPTNTEAGMSYRIFGVIQANATSGTYVFSSIHSQTMDITFSGTTVQARVTNSQQWTFNWSITQLL